MTLSPPSSASHTASRDISGTPAAAVPDALAAFVSFFDEQSGSWNSQRTYHYLDASSGARDREESATTFDVARLGEAEVAAVLKCNSKEAVVDEELGSRTAGFRSVLCAFLLSLLYAFASVLLLFLGAVASCLASFRGHRTVSFQID